MMQSMSLGLRLREGLAYPVKRGSEGSLSIWWRNEDAERR
ncbi:protein of unknown function [Nitrospira japonica]|uniref:Uncharacterized protein n=1 Tax=Nitrospira japonica TaxID=1325564 RepID=A0A1W1I1U8_9BACT|nr:protein of unknown function [Nitrospira japonica]